MAEKINILQLRMFIFHFYLINICVENTCNFVAHNLTM